MRIGLEYSESIDKFRKVDMLKAYLCGPMSGQTMNQCSTWRTKAVEELWDYYECLSPLRGKEFIPADQVLDPFTNTQNEVGSVMIGAKGILSRDTWDVSRCDVILAVFEDTDRVSIGSVMEIAFAHAYRKPIVAVLDDRHRHPFTVEAITHLCPDLDTALEVMRRLV